MRKAPTPQPQIHRSGSQSTPDACQEGSEEMPSGTGGGRRMAKEGEVLVLGLLIPRKGSWTDSRQCSKEEP